jgi:hypothetical protein
LLGDVGAVTHVYLAFPGYGAIHRAFREFDWDTVPVNFLVALPYLHCYAAEADKNGYRPRRTMLDSGAFSAWNNGDTIDIDALVRESKNPRWTESVSLDVIGDWRGSRQNAIAMRASRSAAMPVFHVGDPWELLAFYCKHWPKVGLGGMVGRGTTELFPWLDQVFARAWPHRFHGFGQARQSVVKRYPFHSVDSSAWQQGPLAFSASVRIRNALAGSVRGVTAKQIVPTLRYSVEYMAGLAGLLRAMWRAELEPLGDWP